MLKYRELTRFLRESRKSWDVPGWIKCVVLSGTDFKRVRAERGVRLSAGEMIGWGRKKKTEGTEEKEKEKEVGTGIVLFGEKEQRG